MSIATELLIKYPTMPVDLAFELEEDELIYGEGYFEKIESKDGETTYVRLDPSKVLICR